MLVFPSSERNIGPITEILKKELVCTTKQWTGVEIGSGSGKHIVTHAESFPNVHWHPTDICNEHIDSINAYINHTGVTNVEQARILDASSSEWGFDANSVDLIINVNVIHISPFSVCEGIISNAGLLLREGGFLVFYGPFAVDGKLYPQSNEDFDTSLRSRDTNWGIRDIKDVRHLAEIAGLVEYSSHVMPANNMMYFFQKNE